MTISMNDLNIQQVILLTLLVAFVTSISTGITVVSLLGQSAEPVTQTINRVVEKTVERIVEEPKKEGDKPVERIVETIIVNQEDLTVEAVEKNSNSLVRIYSFEGKNKIFKGLGVVTTGDGNIVADVGTNSVAGNDMVVVINSIDVPLELVRTGLGFSLFKAEQTEGVTFTPATFADSQNARLAQSVILLSGQNKNIVSAGIITNLNVSSDGLATEEIIASVDTSKILTGSILLNLNGEIIAMRADGSLTTASSFTPSNKIKNFLYTQE